jgi:hypothetical protein
LSKQVLQTLDYKAVVLILFAYVDLIRRILRQMVEQLGVVVHVPSALLQVHEHLVLLPHHTCQNVMGAKSIAELGPWHLVVRGVSGCVVDPPRTSISLYLLRGKEDLLKLRAAQEPKLGLDRPKRVVGF